jgi:hypothetical protein
VFHLVPWHTLDLRLLGLAGLAAAVVVIAAFRARAGAGVAAALIVFLPGSAFGYTHNTTQSQLVLPQRVVARALQAVEAAFPSVSCIGWDTRSDPQRDWDFYNTRLFDPGYRFEVFDANRGQKPCSPVVLSGAGLADLPAYPGAQVLLAGNDGLAVWVLAGKLQERMESGGWLPAEGTPGPLAPTAQNGSVDVLAVGRTRVRPGQPPPPITVAASGVVPLQLLLTHTGVGVWPSLGSLGRGFSTGSVRVALRWYRAGDRSTEVGPEGRAEMVVSLVAGRSLPVLAAVVPSVAKAGPGSYDVQLALIQEAVGNLAGVRPVWLHVTVVPG